MKIYFGADHGGYRLKEVLQKYVQEELKLEVVDLGTFGEESVDYPDYAREVAEKVYENAGTLGILVCGTGTGMCIAANKHVGIRAASCTNEMMGQFARAHNNANILCLGQRVITEEMGKSIAKIFLATPFDGERHEVRVQKITAMESGKK
ncbi:MAG: ribose 5-phosphate isomerase B [Candidatus Gracilibacteria bacterium]